MTMGALSRNCISITGIADDERSLVRSLSECVDLCEARALHASLAAAGNDKGIFFGNLMIEMYTKCSSFTDAYQVFQGLENPNSRSCNLLIAANAQNGHFDDAVHVFREMQQMGLDPDSYTLSIILGVYTKQRNLVQGRKVHDRIIQMGFSSDEILATGLINFYGKCKCLEEARKVFQNLENAASVGCWTSMISACNQHGDFELAIHLYRLMKLEGVKPNRVTYVIALNACSLSGSSSSLKQGREIHQCLVNEGLDVNLVVGTSLINMYGKCKRWQDARMAFEKLQGMKRDIICWNAMVAAYAQNNLNTQAFDMVKTMLLEGVRPDKFTLSMLISRVETAQEAEFVTMILLESGLEQEYYLANTLVSMHGKRGWMSGARKVFQRMKHRDHISWTAMIDACISQGHFQEAVKLYHEMNLEGSKPNDVTFASVLEACLGLGDLSEGKLIHAAILSSGIQMNYFVQTALVNMYGKCGSMILARDVFEGMDTKDIVTWTSLIASHARNGNGNEALELFQRMELQGFIPNEVAFIIMLSACSHAGLVDEAFVYFASMTRDYGILPDAEHCLCLIDMLSRAGRLQDAEEFIDKMPFKATEVAWASLLGACKTSGDMHRGVKVSKGLLLSKNIESSPYATLASVFTQ